MSRQVADLLLDGIGRLYTVDAPGDDAGPRRGAALADVGIVENAAVAAYEGRIVAAGPSEAVRKRVRILPGAEYHDVEGQAVCPGFVDPHTHAVFARPRPEEFGRRLVGESYASIAQSGGGIRASVRHFREIAEDELRDRTRRRLRDCLRLGSTTVEVKSGYGLDLEQELKALRVVDSLRGEARIPRLVATCLAAHEIPDDFRDDRDAWLDTVCDTILPQVADLDLAERVDVFCEPHVFTVEESRRVLRAGQALGLRACVHADELEGSGGAELAVEVGADSADHLGRISDAGIDALAGGNTVGVLLPGTIFSLGLDNWAPARTMIERGAPVALATDFNPGSNYCESVPLTMAIACTRMALHPHEALVMATLNAAWALGRADRVGSLAEGKLCDLVVLRSDSIDELCQHLGQDEIDRVVLHGRSVWSRVEDSSA